MITCERCQTINVDGAQYCDECGASLLVQQKQQYPDSTGDSGFNNGGGRAVRGPRKQSTQLSRSSEDRPPEKEAARRATSAAKIAAAEQRLRPSSSVPVPPAHATLTIQRGVSAGKEFPLQDDEAYIGRWDADSGIFPDVDLDADDPEAKISRRHARITRRAGQYLIEDLGSTNGTFINRGKRLLPGDRQTLKDGDELIIGKTFLKFRVIK